MATKFRESKMLDKVRNWRKKAFHADTAKSSSERSKEDEKLAEKYGLPLSRKNQTLSSH